MRRRCATSRSRCRRSSRAPRSGAGTKLLARAALQDARRLRRCSDPGIAFRPALDGDHGATDRGLSSGPAPSGGAALGIIGVRVSLGALSAVEKRVSNAVQPCVDEAWERVRAADVKHTDGTSWSQGGVTMALWTLAAVGVTVFKILADSSKSTLRPLYRALRGFLTSDRAKALNFGPWPSGKFVGRICCGSTSRFGASWAERSVRGKVARLHGLGLRLLARLQRWSARPRHVRGLAHAGATAARGNSGSCCRCRYLGPVRRRRGHPRAPTSPVEFRRPG